MSLRSRYSVSPVSSSTPSPALSPASSVSLTSIKKSEKTARRHRKTRHAHKHKPLPDLPSAVTQAVTQTAPPSRYYASAPGPHSPSSQDDSLSAVTAFERFITKNNATLTVRPAGTGHALHHAILLDGRPLLQCRQGLLNRKTIKITDHHGGAVAVLKRTKTRSPHGRALLYASTDANAHFQNASSPISEYPKAVHSSNEPLATLDWTSPTSASTFSHPDLNLRLSVHRSAAPSSPFFPPSTAVASADRPAIELETRSRRSGVPAVSVAGLPIASLEGGLSADGEVEVCVQRGVDAVLLAVIIVASMYALEDIQAERAAATSLTLSKMRRAATAKDRYWDMKSPLGGLVAAPIRAITA